MLQSLISVRVLVLNDPPARRSAEPPRESLALEWAYGVSVAGSGGMLCAAAKPERTASTAGTAGTAGTGGTSSGAGVYWVYALGALGVVLDAKAGGVSRSITLPILNQRTESARLYEHSP